MTPAAAEAATQACGMPLTKPGYAASPRLLSAGCLALEPSSILVCLPATLQSAPKAEGAHCNTLPWPYL